MNLQEEMFVEVAEWAASGLTKSEFLAYPRYNGSNSATHFDSNSANALGSICASDFGSNSANLEDQT